MLKENFKICKICNLKATIDFFPKRQLRCKKCTKEYYNNWREANRVSFDLYQKEYKLKNRSKISKNDFLRRRYDLNHKISMSLRNRLNSAIKKNAKRGSAVKDLGCSIQEFRVYIEKKFKPGMSWENWSKTGWHIDHKIPLSYFDLTNAEQFKLACHYSNLQPMWASDNLKKGALNALRP